MPTDAERKRRPVELRLTYVQAAVLQSWLEDWVRTHGPSRDRAAMALIHDHLRAAHSEAAGA